MSNPPVFVPDRTDLVLLTALQDDLPLVPRPWRVLADRIGITEDEILRRMKTLREGGIIRGISPVLESRHLGLQAATLVALRVPEDRIDEVAAIISSYPEVSHNFRRDHSYSLWFTLAAKDREGIRKVLAEILDRTGISATDTLDLPTVSKMKIDVRFSFVPAPSREGTDGSD